MAVATAVPLAAPRYGARLRSAQVDRRPRRRNLSRDLGGVRALLDSSHHGHVTPYARRSGGSDLIDRGRAQPTVKLVLKE